MNDQRYAPPVAVVEEEPAFLGADLDRPRTIHWALRIFWASFVLGIPEAIYHLFTPPADRPLVGYFVRWSFAMTIGFAVSFALYAPVGLGKGWARWTNAVVALAFAGIMLTILLLAPPRAGYPLFEFSRLAVQCVGQVIGVILLFLPASTAWFRAMQAASAARS